MSHHETETDTATQLLARGHLLIVEELRESRSLTRMILEKLGQICDQNAEIVDQMGQLRRDSERSIRVVKQQVERVAERLQPLEADYEARRRAGAG